MGLGVGGGVGVDIASIFEFEGNSICTRTHIIVLVIQVIHK